MDPPRKKVRPETWIEASLLVPAELAEVAAEGLCSLSGRGVITEEPEGPEGPVLVRGFIAAGPKAPAGRAAFDTLAARLGEAAAPQAVVPGLSELPDQDWNLAWKRHFHPEEVAPGLLVGPPWEPVEPKAGQIALVIDPGQAFGTGQHESTVLCLRRLVLLAGQGRLDRPVLDVGCGTGILALAALALGAPRAHGIDIDPDALEAAEKNAALNGLSAGLEWSDTPLEELEGRYAVVLANLTAGDLLALAEPLATRLAPGGELICSGVMLDQAEAVRAGLEARGLDLVASEAMGEWTALVFS